MKTSHEAYYCNVSGMQDMPSEDCVLYGSAVQRRATSSNITKTATAPFVGQP